KNRIMAEFLLIIGIIVLFSCLLLTLAALFYVSGIFHRVEIGTGKPPIGRVVIAYKFTKGPYKEAGHMFTELMKYTPNGYKTLGIYYDDPKLVEPDNLRYAVGTVLSENGSEIDDHVRKVMEDAGYTIFNLPEVSYVVKSSFPFRTTLSILIAVARVYPRLDQYIKEHKLCAHPFIEVYEGSTMYFMCPLAKQNEFYVEEAKEMRRDDDEDGDDIDDDSSLLSTSVVTGDISRDTSYMGSFVDGNVSDSDEDRKSESKEKSFSEECAAKDTKSVMKETEGSKVTVQDLTCPAGTNFQDSGFSSEPAITPQLSPTKEEEEENDGNESGSSFEEISMEKENLPAKE
ncbi:hypothetical protein FSP39_018508, partial [Pinctada imbricata]